MKRHLCFIVLCFVLAAGVFAQTAERLEGLLNAEKLTYGEAAQFVLEAADLLAAGADEAFAFAAGQKWLPAKAASNGTARLDGLSLLVMNAFQLKGGLVYSILRNPHHAYRELQYQGILDGKDDPAMDVSGSLLLSVVERVFSYKEGSQQ